jgi:NADPH:quinone reductase
VGADYAEQVVRAMAWNGRYLVIGFAGGKIPAIPLNLPLLKGCGILGVSYGAFAKRDPDANRALVGQLLTWVREGRLRPRISATLGLEDAAAALDALLARGVTGKIVLVTTGPPPAAR